MRRSKKKLAEKQKFLLDNPEIKEYEDLKEKRKEDLISDIKSDKFSNSKFDKEKLLDMTANNFYWPTTEDYAIKLDKVYRYYSSSGYTTKVLNGITLNIPKSKVTMILGPSGSGKTTLMNIISGLDSPNAGDVITNNYNLSYMKENDLVKFRASHVSFIFQSYNLIPTLTVWDNVKIGREVSKDSDYESKIDIDELLKRLEIYDQKEKYPYQLSGGQKQRVSIARAIVKDPDIIFADEPTGALDTKMAREVFNVLVSLSKTYKKTLVIVTHDPKYIECADFVVEFSSGLIKKTIVNKNPISPNEVS
ncbi:MAG: ABC transporter ATP-binding protein [Mycoplasmataceae bacterium]|nr:ABC transporter ATP-binding protein [Mycoplasmataceae bacterium]